jgi:hypothetical protein
MRTCAGSNPAFPIMGYIMNRKYYFEFLDDSKAMLSKFDKLLNLTFWDKSELKIVPDESDFNSILMGLECVYNTWLKKYCNEETIKKLGIK